MTQGNDSYTNIFFLQYYVVDQSVFKHPCPGHEPPLSRMRLSRLIAVALPVILSLAAASPIPGIGNHNVGSPEGLNITVSNLNFSNKCAGPCQVDKGMDIAQ